MTIYYVPGQAGFIQRDNPEEQETGDFRPVPEGSKIISEEKHRALLAAPAINWDTDPPSEKEWAPDPVSIARKQLAQARELFADSDKTILRCVENNVPIPAAWKEFRAQLRAFLNTDGAGDLPSRPAEYPAGS